MKLLPVKITVHVSRETYEALRKLAGSPRKLGAVIEALVKLVDKPVH